jgi:hypothetical protein
MQEQGLEGGSSQPDSGMEGCWRRDPLQEMKTTLMQHLHKLWSLSQAGKADLVMCL